MHRLALLATLLFAACQSRVAGYPRDWYAGGSFAAIPGVGLAVEGGKVLARPEQFDWSGEAQFVWQFLDDKDLADDNRADHGEMLAARAGFKHSTNPGHKRHLTLRYGFEFYRATGDPGIVEQAGDYYGGYVGFGFETELSRHWTMGPELSVAFLEGEGSFEVVPGFFWHLAYDF
ncbi:MAG: hypothetical protein ACHQ1G_06270 [Planctomycetota bacterium]